ncbi:MAG: 4-hydroxy-tetrahydrodipicolinate reductase [Candidatus Sumerlaeia bacterium]|nr:4-hydroxy-tetrahydrodipicolinate reductase [Candidatus Sumerlaeia bacterium]
MRLALIGYGKMGRAIEALAPARGHEIVATVDLKDRAAKFRRLTRQAVEAADVCIEFTAPNAALGNLLRLCQLGKRVVTGTTGWFNHLDEFAAVVAKKKATVLYGANFSIGVNLFYRLVERAAELFGALDDRDFYVAEAHHRAKLDAPSGTAKRLAEIILAKSRRKKRPLQRLEGPIAEDQLQIVSTRAGWITGVHRVGIEGPHDSIVLEHQARSRDTFADGALRAAEWIVSAAPGLYRFEDVLDQLVRMAP